MKYKVSRTKGGFNLRRRSSINLIKQLKVFFISPKKYHKFAAFDQQPNEPLFIEVPMPSMFVCTLVLSALCRPCVSSSHVLGLLTLLNVVVTWQACVLATKAVSMSWSKRNDTMTDRIFRN